MSSLIPDEEANLLSGSLILSRTSLPRTLKPLHWVVRQEVQFRGGPARSLPSRLTAPKTPGIYRLDFGGPNLPPTGRPIESPGGSLFPRRTSHLVKRYGFVRKQRERGYACRNKFESAAWRVGKRN